MGEATEAIANKAGAGVGGLLNASFGNAAELIIAIVALRDGYDEVVKASLTGSIIGNLLLVLGLSLFAGGLAHHTQRFNKTGIRSLGTMLTIATISLVAPGMLHALGGRGLALRERELSFDIAIVLLCVYGASLVFSLRTHKQFFTGEALPDASPHSLNSTRLAIVTLCVATAVTVWLSEILVSTLEPAAQALGMNHTFVGVIILAMVGNAAEHGTAVTFARKNRMDLSLGIALGSSIQVALFVAPVLVLLSYLIAPHPMDLLFTPLEIVIVGLSVYIADHVSGDGESHWLEGVQLLAAYLIFAITFFYLSPVG